MLKRKKHPILINGVSHDNPYDVYRDRMVEKYGDFVSCPPGCQRKLRALYRKWIYSIELAKIYPEGEKDD